MSHIYKRVKEQAQKGYEYTSFLNRENDWEELVKAAKKDGILPVCDTIMVGKIKLARVSFKR